VLSNAGIGDLGPAEDVWFGKNGAILGKYMGDKDAQGMSLSAGKDIFYYTFEWKGGKTTIIGKK